MAPRKEFEFAEVLVDRLLLESFPTERSAYFRGKGEEPSTKFLDQYRSKLSWHISHSLSKRQREVIKGYLSGQREREMAESMGITQQVVNIYKRRAINRLRKLMHK